MFHPFDRVTQDGNGKSRTYTVFDAISCSPNGAEVWKTLSDGSISGLTLSGQTSFADGTAPLPSMTFGTDNTKGFYSQSTNAIGVALAGAELFRFSTSGLSIFSDVIGLRLGTLSDAIILRGAADTIDQRRSTNAQTFRLYNTFTDAANYERVNFAWSSSIFDIAAAAAGTGSVRAIRLDGSTIGFRIAGSTRWQVDASGHFMAVTDNTNDIGASGANRPRNGFFAGTLSYGTFTGNADAPVTGFITITDSGGTTRKLAVIA
jgi:hypothetical protein